MSESADSLDGFAERFGLEGLEALYPKEFGSAGFETDYTAMRELLTGKLGEVYDEHPPSAFTAVNRLLHNVALATWSVGPEHTHEMIDHRAGTQLTHAMIELAIAIDHTASDKRSPRFPLPLHPQNLMLGTNLIKQRISRPQNAPDDVEKLHLARLVPPLVECMDGLFLDENNRETVWLSSNEEVQTSYMENFDSVNKLLRLATRQ